MRSARHVTFAICMMLAACGGHDSTGETSIVSGSGGSGGTSTGGQPGISDSGQPDLGVGTTTGGGSGIGGDTGISGDTGIGGGTGIGGDRGFSGDSGGGPTTVDASDEPPIIDPPLGPPETLSNYGYQWKSSWFIRGCANKLGHDCINIAVCPNGGAPNFEDRGLVVTELFPIGGTVGTTYAVTFQVNGISEGKYYQGGTRDAGDTIPPNVDTADLDMFYRGGTPIVSNYDVLRMRILDSKKKEIARYYLNAAAPNSGMESHRTFHLSYTKTIDVPGGGFAEYLTQDSNCHSIDNCNDGDVSDAQCPAPRGIPHEEDNPLPPIGVDPNTGHAVALGTLNTVSKGKPWHSQIVHFTITNMVPK